TLASAPAAAAADVCHTAGEGRSHFNHRLAVTGGTPAELSARIAAHARAETVNGAHAGVVDETDRPAVAFLFTGQGAQYAGMGRALYETHAAFRQTLDACDEATRDVLEKPLLSVIFGETDEA